MQTPESYATLTELMLDICTIKLSNLNHGLDLDPVACVPQFRGYNGL